MKQLYLLIAALLCMLPLRSQDYLDPEAGHKVAYHFSDTVSIQTFDVNDAYFYFDDGDTIYQFDPAEVRTSAKFGKPAEYDLQSYPSFLSLSPDGTSLWAGYTDLANVDARIYQVDPATGTWEHRASFPSNWDLEYWNDSLLVSGLNSADYNAPNAIYVLDTSGLDQHRVIIETGGSSAGLAIDSRGNLYYGTSFLAGSNALYRWDSASLAAVIETPGAAALQLADAEKLTDLPMGVYDCEVDAADQVVFSMNVWGSTQVLARWDGLAGDGFNYDTLALSDSWLGMVKSRGDYTIQTPGNSIFTVGYGQPLADLHTSDYPPVQIQPLPILTGKEGNIIQLLDLNEYFTDLDDRPDPDFEITLLSDPSVADLSIDGSILSGAFLQPGQANIQIEASSAGRSVSGRSLVSTWPEPAGEFLVSEFEDLNLDAENYWNGSDGSGSFASGQARFHNDYNTDYQSWSGWSYSNTTDISTPGYMNQYSAITGGGFSGNLSDGNYGISSLYGPAVIDFDQDRAFAPEGFFVTNSTYAALSMEQGDFFAKRFGGADGTDPDYFTLHVWGQNRGVPTDSISFNLADFRDGDPENDYIIKTWQWVDLSSLGKVDTLLFGLESSDMGDWGMNTPAYFCMDDLYLNPDAPPFVATPLGDFDTYGYLADTVIDLSQVFSDPDDPDTEITKRIASNSNETMAAASIEGEELSIQFAYLTKAAYQDTEIEIVIEGISNGLAVRDSFTISHEPGGIEQNSGLAVRVYPNPSTGLFTIQSDQGDVMRVSLYNLNGTLVKEEGQFSSGQQLDIRELPAGSYILRIQGSYDVAVSLIQKL